MTILSSGLLSYFLAKTPEELNSWRACLRLAGTRETPFWRFGMDFVWRHEVEPIFPSGEGE